MRLSNKILYHLLMFFNIFIPTKKNRRQYRENIEFLFAKPKQSSLKKIKVMSYNETLNYIIENNCSFTRYGDGEIGYMLFDDFKHHFQSYNPILQEKLKEILTNPIQNCLIGLPHWIDNPESDKQFFLAYYPSFKQFLNENIVYGDSHVFAHTVKENIEIIKKIWNNKRIIIVTGKNSAFIYDDRIFSNAKSVSYIYTKAIDAFSEYDNILSEIENMYTEGSVVLLSLGLTATCLAYDLSKKNIQAIDIGHITNYYLQQIGELENIEKLRQSHKYVDGETNIKDLLVINQKIINKKYDYDLIFSLGEACSCSQSLRDSKLQVYSYPFDWLYGSNFETRMGILSSRFLHFIDKGDLEYFYSERSIKCTAYKNNQNGLVFNHDFLENIDFDKMYAEVKTKYDRRTSRLLENIEKANSVLIVYIEIPNNTNPLTDNTVLIDTLAKVKSAFNSKDIKLLYFTNSFDFNSFDYKEEQITESIIKVTGNYKSTLENAPDYLVDFDFFKDYLKKYRLNLPFIYKFKRIMLKTIINLIPIKSKRKRLREEYHV